MREIHPYTKLLFPATREKMWIRRHRDRGHKIRHYGSPELSSPCYWRCNCTARYTC